MGMGLVSGSTSKPSSGIKVCIRKNDTETLLILSAASITVVEPDTFCGIIAATVAAVTDYFRKSTKSSG